LSNNFRKLPLYRFSRLCFYWQTWKILSEISWGAYLCNVDECKRYDVQVKLIVMTKQ